MIFGTVGVLGYNAGSTGRLLSLSLKPPYLMDETSTTPVAPEHMNMPHAPRGRSGNPYLIPGAIVIAGVFIAGAVYLTAGKGGQASVGGREIKASVNPITAEDHVFGASNPDVYVIEYSDYQCPFCERFHVTMKDIVGEYSGRVAWVYRHFPLESIHPEARPAAIASECIATLGGADAFWQFTDQLFADQKSMSAARYRDIARTLGINEQAFTDCTVSDAPGDRVDSDFQNGQDLGGQGTPFNVILTRKGDTLTFSGALPKNQVKVLVDRALGSL